jgi:hypothetical protein
MTRGEIVRRKLDPVHSGRIERVDITRGLVNVRWFGSGRGTLEFMIPKSDLEFATDWKGGQPAANEQAQMRARGMR